MSEAKKVEKIKLNWFSVGLMFFGVGSIQLVLDRGSSWGWFSSMWVCLLVYSATISLIFFIRTGIREKNFFVNLRLFSKTQFTFSLINMFLFSSTLLGGSILYSLVLQTIYGVSAENVGILYIPDAIAAIVALGIALPLVKYMDLRLMIIMGAVISLIGNAFLMFLSDALSLSQFVWAEVFTSFGKIFFILPALIISTDGLSKNEAADASSLINFGRNIGASFGASATVIFLTHCTNVGWARLHAFASPYTNGYSFWQSQQQLFVSANLSNPIVNSTVSNQVSHQAALAGFNASFACIEVLYLLCIIPVFFLSAPKSVNLSAIE